MTAGALARARELASCTVQRAGPLQVEVLRPGPLTGINKNWLSLKPTFLVEDALKLLGAKYAEDQEYDEHEEDSTAELGQGLKQGAH